MRDVIGRDTFEPFELRPSDNVESPPVNPNPDLCVGARWEIRRGAGE
jgi:hypothetical protein